MWGFAFEKEEVRGGRVQFGCMWGRTDRNMTLHSGCVQEENADVRVKSVSNTLVILFSEVILNKITKVSLLLFLN